MFGTKVLEERKSKFNGLLRVVRSLGFGTYIQVNNLTQSGGVVESIWKSTLKRTKKEDISSVLILGLGGGTVAKLIKRYFPNAKIRGIEIDPAIIELGKKYLGLKGVDILIGDAYTFVRENKVKYDLVIVDLYIGDVFPSKFEEESFLKQLSKNKLVIFNRLYFGEKKKEVCDFKIKLKRVFNKVRSYYPPANVMFICS